MSRTRAFKSEAAAAEWLQDNGYRFISHIDGTPEHLALDSGKDCNESSLTLWRHLLADSGHCFGDGRAELYPSLTVADKFYVRRLTIND